jgi:hypothetical protein
MLYRWRFEIAQHEYGWAQVAGHSHCALAPLPPQNPDATCHCYRGMGYFRKRHPLDCGNTKCCSCHWEKYVEPKARQNKLRAAIVFELDAEGI